MSEVPAWDRKYLAIRSIVDLVDARLVLLTTRKDGPHARQVAAAYLARCRRLVIGLDTLRLNDSVDLMGGMLRIFFEAWLYGMWVLLVGEDAVAKLNAAYRRSTNTLIERAALEVETHGVPSDAEFPPPVEQIATVVGDLLVAAGDAGGSQVFWSYQLVYRAESGRGIHGGIAAVVGHLRDRTSLFAVSADRQEAVDGTGMLFPAGILLSVLARHVFLAFGVGVCDLDSLSTPLSEDLPK